ncbi:EFR1 family ferrodoxin [Slackia exigua]|uniref:EFR1 family ferrodoxin n=1 Tax=Slackia exigua TaxID=84109 RepID=UPI00249F35B4|nr:EFR1 family ferrodoxin [Slackia exigua]
MEKRWASCRPLTPGSCPPLSLRSWDGWTPRPLQALRVLRGHVLHHARAHVPRGAEDGPGRPFAPFDAGFSVRMPDTWTPIFDLSDPERVAETVADAEPLIDDVIGKVVARESGDWCGPRTPRIAAPAMHLHHLSMRRTSHFTVDETCIGCGLCAKRCPAQAIEMRNGMPTWAKESCFACLRCLHSCPKFAIQYGRNTRAHGQYRHP